MLANLNMHKMTSRADARRMIDGNGLTVSGLYQISGAVWLLAEQEQFSSPTKRRFMNFDGLSHDKTMGPLNTRTLTDVPRRARGLIPPFRKSKFIMENKPNKEYHKTYG